MGAKDNYHHGALREALLSEAMTSLEKDGIQGLSLRGLAEAVGVSKTAPYRHFASKRDLLVTLAAEGFREFADRLEESQATAMTDAITGPGAAAGPWAGPPPAVVAPPPEAPADPLSCVRALSQAYLSFAKERPALYRLMFSRLGYSLHSESCRLNSERALATLFTAVQQAQASGWRPEQEGRALALSVWASVHGWASLLIDGLLPDGLMREGEQWPDFARVLFS
jgi:AcrR family transcriptional regulator